MKKTLLWSILMLMSIGVSAQPTISFERTEHDYGQINEVDGRVSTIFEFTNSGTEPLVLSNVRASCGCTTPKWTRTPIEPGQKGQITVTYNPTGRPGKFQKSITITSNATNPTTKLYIKGEVIPKAAEPKDKYPVKMGALSLTAKSIQFGTIMNTGQLTKNIEYANLSSEPISVDILVNDKDGFLTAVMTLEEVQPKQTGKLTVNFDANKCSEFGSVTRYVYVIINGKRELSDTYQITLNATVREDFSKMTAEERQQAPIFEMANKLDLGEMKAGATLTHKLEFKNAGVNQLIIRKIACRNASGLSFKPAKSTLKGGKSSILNINLSTKDLKPGTYTRQVEVITNDPNRSRLFLTITWKVVE